MPLEAALPPLDARAAELNQRFRHHAASDVLAEALDNPLVGRTALVSSFGAESVVLLHMVSKIDRTTPVLFLDTELLFPETLDYQKRLAERLKLSVEVITPDRSKIFVADPNNRLNATNPDLCCQLRKTEPLERALQSFDAWVTGRKRMHGGARASLDLFEAEGERIKVNPLAHWSRDDIADYMSNNKLPRHPLVGKGYASIGCLPCTTRVDADEDPRAGRWRGREKTECGIHFSNGAVAPAKGH